MGQSATTAYTRKSTRAYPLVANCSAGGLYSVYPPRPRYSSTDRQVWFPSDIASYWQETDDLVYKDMALHKLLNNIRKEASHSQAIIPIVEGVLEMRYLITSLARSATTLTKTLLKIRKIRGASAYQYASNAWLTWSFGISPMLSDVDSIAKSVASLLESPHNTVCTGKSKKEWFTGKAKTATSGAFGTQLWVNYDLKHTLSYKYIAGMRFDVQSANNYGIRKQFGLEVAELIPTAWELIPYSWLVDYFTTVGAWLEDTFVSPPGDTIYVLLNKKYTCEAYIYGRYAENTATDAIIFQNVVPGAVNYKSFTRTPLSALPHPSLHMKTSSQVGKFAVNKLLNLVALLAPSGILYPFKANPWTR